MNAPRYERESIGSINALGRALGFSPKDLRHVAQTASRYYRPNEPQPKSSGGVRQTYTVNPPLYEVQGAILHRILQGVEFPSYLFAVKDEENPRDYIRAAKLHVGCQELISIDVRNFFPSVREEHVLNTWQYFFNFPVEVAHLLTQLTMYSGFLPQGAQTSSYLACLLLWDCEPGVVDELTKRNLVYSRYIDDIYVSAKRKLNREEESFVVTRIVGMVHGKNLEVHRKGNKKITIIQNTQRMQVHNLNIDAGNPTKPSKTRRKIRAAVHQCEHTTREDRQSDEYVHLYRSTLGRVNDMKRVNRDEAESFAKRLAAVKPTQKNTSGQR